MNLYISRFNSKDEPAPESKDGSDPSTPAKSQIRKKKSKLEIALNEKLGKNNLI